VSASEVDANAGLPFPPLPDFGNLSFSLTVTDYLYLSKGNWLKVGSPEDADVQWDGGKFLRFGDLALSPAAAYMSYGLGIFEGLKAQRTADGRILLFRPDMNAKRFRSSAERLLMAQFPEKDFVNAVVELVQRNMRFVPSAEQGSFYVRPVQHATEAILGLSPCSEFLVTMYGSPVGSYFSGKRARANNEGSAGLKLRCLKQGRVAPGGTGYAKAMGNYAGGIYIANKWKKQGYDDVMYLESRYQKFITETSGSNVFCRMKSGVIVTPALSDQILPGVTRDSVIQVARHLGHTVEERELSFDEVVADGVEVFCTGTAWTALNVGRIDYEDNEGNVKTKILEVTGGAQPGILKLLRGIQTGEEEDIFGWTLEVPQPHQEFAAVV